MDIRVRFAPSPTGNLHIGTLRTAIFNWLYAKNKKGKFVLRIEDTDLARSERQFEESIFQGLNWLGLIPNEGPENPGNFGPYRQSERINQGLYLKYAEKLIESGSAYYCFCTDEDLDNERKIADSKSIPYVYSQKCLKLSQSEINDKLKQKIPYTIRFKINTTTPIIVNDLIKGKIEFDPKLLSDFVIIKSDKTPSYNFAVVIDDYLMQISHVIRGEDHISNTARQIQIYESLKARLPNFAHLPMILGPDKAKLSKRHGATSVIEYKNQGYLAEAILNYLSLLGWSPPNEKEILTKDELVQLFSLEKINKANAIFDVAKLNWMNGQYIRKLDKDALFLRVKEFINPDYLKLDEKILTEMIFSIKDNLNFLIEVNDYLTVYFLTEKEYQENIQKFTFTETDKTVIELFYQALLKNETELNFDNLTQIIKLIQTQTGFKNVMIFKPLRLIITGVEKGPHILEFCQIKGKAFLIQRLKSFSEK